MKYLFLFANSLLLGAALYMFVGMSEVGNIGSFILLLAYVTLPFGLPLYASWKYARGISDRTTWPLAGVIAGFLACVFYAGGYIYKGPDSQSDLILAIVPFYQLVGYIITGAITAYIIRTGKLYE